MVVIEICFKNIQVFELKKKMIFNIKCLVSVNQKKKYMITSDMACVLVAV